MGRKKVFALIAAGALSLMAVAGLVTYRTVSAQSSEPTTTAPAASPDVQRGFPGGRHGESDELLAQALGITTEALQAARQAAQTEALSQAVSQGLITQEQADQFQAGERALRMPGMKGLASSIDYEALLADALGITTEALQAARQQARAAAIDQALADGTITQEQADLMKGRGALFGDSAFQSSMQAAFETAVNQAVSSGVITQAQADQILANQSGRMFGGPGGHGRHGLRGGDFLEAPPAEQ